MERFFVLFYFFSGRFGTQWRTPMDSLHQGFGLGAGGAKSGKEVQGKKRLSETVAGGEKERNWKFDSGIIHNCGKGWKHGGKGEVSENGIPLRETQFRSRGGVL